MAGKYVFINDAGSITGAAMAGSIADMRLALTTGSPYIYVSGYYAPGDGGGGWYYYDSSDTTSTDNGGTIIVANDGGRWKFEPSQVWTVKTFGATGNGATDSASMTRETAAINNALIYAASLSNGFPNWVGFPAQNNEVYVVNGQIQVNSDSNIGIEGIGGVFWLKYNGSTLNTPGSSGALVYVTGLDHAFGGIRRAFLDCNYLTQHAVYMEGTLNAGFEISYIHFKHSLSHGMWFNYNSGSSGHGPVDFSVNHLTSFPATANFNGTGKLAVCGGFALYIVSNVNNGRFRVENSAFDNGTSGMVGIGDGAATYADCAVTLSNVRFEMNNDNIHNVVCSYKTGASPGMVVLDDCEFIDATAGVTTCYLVYNDNATSAVRPAVTVQNFKWSNVLQYVYKETSDTSYDKAYNANVGNQQTLYLASGANVRTVTYAATITPTLSRAPETVVQITLAGNPTINIPSTAVFGHRLTFNLIQDATGGRLPAWNGGYIKPADAAAPAANKRGSITFVCDGTNWISNSPALTFA